ncbi:hypothetical protein [uncultured Clostridium sp.]|uniref:hypothetical protein n=1 Tax=uncultured Clostridium sp. TaxID=59620 RepID=UPI0026167BC2|nr:hypothetical protein [uncultured Clostridium sp.]
MKRKTVVGVIIAVIIVGALGIGTKQFIKYRNEQKATKLFEEQSIPKVVTEKQLGYLEGYYTTTKAFESQDKKETLVRKDDISGSITNSQENIGKVVEKTPNINGIDILDGKVMIIKNGKAIYETKDKIYSRVIKADEFWDIFKVNPQDLGLELTQKEFVIYKVGNINIFQLSQGDILFTYNGTLNYGMNDTVDTYPNQISFWYGDFQVTNKAATPNVVDKAKDKDLTGEQVIINKSEFKYGDMDVKDPQYYVFEFKPEDIYNKADYNGEIGQDGDKIFFLGVLPKDEKLTRLEKYMATQPGYKVKGMTPIILKSNGEIEVMNGAKTVFNAKRVLASQENK